MGAVFPMLLFRRGKCPAAKIFSTFFASVPRRRPPPFGPMIRLEFPTETPLRMVFIGDQRPTSSVDRGSPWHSRTRPYLGRKASRLNRGNTPRIANMDAAAYSCGGRAIPKHESRPNTSERHQNPPVQGGEAGPCGIGNQPCLMVEIRA